METDNPPTIGGTEQIPNSEPAAPGRHPRPIIMTFLISWNLDLQQPREAGTIVL